MKQPLCKIFLDNKDITDNFAKRLISLQIVDNRGLTADTISIKLDDADKKIKIPEMGKCINVYLGWKGKGENKIKNEEISDDISTLFFQNKFIIDEYSFSGSPDTLTIQGKSANFTDTFTQVRDDSYDGMTIHSIAKKIASRNNIMLMIIGDIGNIKVPHIDQTKESDCAFLTRITNDVGGCAMIKNGYLIIKKQDETITVSGRPIPEVNILRQVGDKYNFSQQNREKYTGVQALWKNYKNPSIIPMKINTNKDKENTKSVIEGSNEKLKVLRYIYANYESAERAAKSELAKIRRGSVAFSINLACGRPDISPEMPATVKGFKNEIDAANWIITKCTHTLNAEKGYTTQVDLEKPADKEFYTNINIK